MSNGPNKVCNRCPWVRTWSQYIKNFKRTGIKFREAMLLSPAGETMAHDGESLLTDSDTKVRLSSLTSGSQWQLPDCSRHSRLMLFVE